MKKFIQLRKGRKEGEANEHHSRHVFTANDCGVYADMFLAIGRHKKEQLLL